MDNVSPDHAIAKDTLRSIVNCDVLDDGTLRTRSGLTLRVAGQAHSAWPPDGRGGALYAVVNGVLTRYTRAVSGALTGTLLRTGIGGPELPVAYLELAGEVYYSNGSVSGKVVAGAHRPWGVERPSGQPAVSAITSGALYAGRYQVAVTFVDNLGEESGCGLTEAIDVAAGGGIAVSKIPQPVDATVARIRVYVSEANGEVLYRYGDLAVGTTAVNLARSSTLGKALDTQFLIPPIPGTLLEAYNGRIYIGRSNVVYFTEPVRYGAMRIGNNLVFEDEVRIIKDGGVGLWVATAARTWLLQGSGPADFQPIERLSYGAAKGAVTKLPGDKICWIGSKGPVIANMQGGIEGLADEQAGPLVHLAIDDYAYGSAVVRDNDGVRQILAAMGGGVNSTLTAQDYFDIEIIRKS